MTTPAGIERAAPQIAPDPDQGSADTPPVPPDAEPQPQPQPQPQPSVSSGGPGPADEVTEPDKLIRIGSMVKQMLNEVHAAPLDEASRLRLRIIHAAAIRELNAGLAPELCAELERLALPFSEDRTPSDAELRIAHAQLVGWLDGVFHGIQIALFLQQLTARSQIEELRRGTPPPQQLEFPARDGTYL